MTGDYKNIDNLFAKELKNFSAQPPTDVWEGIEQKLAEKKQRKTIFWISRIAATIALLLGATGIMFYLHNNTPKEITAHTTFIEKTLLTKTDSDSSKKQIFTKETNLEATQNNINNELLDVKSESNKNSDVKSYTDKSSTTNSIASSAKSNVLAYNSDSKYTSKELKTNTKDASSSEAISSIEDETTKISSEEFKTNAQPNQNSESTIFTNNKTNNTSLDTDYKTTNAETSLSSSRSSEIKQETNSFNKTASNSLLASSAPSTFKENKPESNINSYAEVNAIHKDSSKELKRDNNVYSSSTKEITKNSYEEFKTNAQPNLDAESDNYASNKAFNTPLKSDYEIADNKSSNSVSTSKIIKPEANSFESESESDLALIQSKSTILEQEELEEQVIIKQETNTKVNEAYLALLDEFKDPDEKIDNYDKWLVGGQAGPQYSYRQLTSEYASQEYINSYNESEDGVIAYAGGVNVAYKPAKRLSIQSGVYYSKIGQSASAQYTDAVSLDNGDALVLYGNTESNSLNSDENVPKVSVSTSMGTVESKLTSSSEISNEEASQISSKYSSVEEVQQYLEFLEIPLIARYAVIDRKIDFHLLGGVSTNFLVASPVYLEDGSYFKETSNLNTINYSSTLGLGFGYNFSEDLVFSLEPQFKYYLNQVNKNSSTEYHPYSFGVYTGVTYSF